MRSRFDLRPRGFTLLEVLVALAIFALAAIVLGSAYVNILTSYDVLTRNSAVSEDVAFARQLVLSEPDRLKVEKGGEFDGVGGRRVHWLATIESTTTADLFTVNFTCEIDEPGKTTQDKTAQTFMLLRPTWSIDVAERDKLKQESRTRIEELRTKRESR